MKFLHCSDLHIDSPLRGFERYEGAPVEAMRGATRQALKNIIDTAIAKKVDLVVVAGDVFDGDWRDFKTGLFFNAQLARLAPSNTKVVLLKGNHDAASEISKALRIPGHVTVLNHLKPQSVTFDDIGVVVHGQSFADRAVTEDLALQYPAAIKGIFNLGLLHTSLGGYAAHQTYAPTTMDVLKAKGYDYWALGHVHQRQILCEIPRVVFCGNSQGRHAHELGPKGCELVTYEDGEITSEFVPVDAVRWARVEVDIEGLNDLDALLDRAQGVLLAEVARSGGRVVATRVVLTGSGRLHALLASSPEKVVAELRNMAIEASDGNAWIEQLKRETRASYDRKAMGGRDDPIGELMRLATRLEISPTELEEVAKEAFGPMWDKLPVEVREQVDFEDPEKLKALLREAEAQVLGLLGGGAA